MNAVAFKKTDRPMVDVIEQYLKEAEKEAKSFQLGNEDYRSFFEFERGLNISFDQQVPQMLAEESEVMLTESIKGNQPTDFLAEELSSLAGPVPVYVSEASETAVQYNERSDYYDLDQVNSSPTNLGSQELSFYHSDEFCSYNRNTKNTSEITSQYKQSEECHIPIKREPLIQEPFDDPSQPQCNDCDYDMLEQHDQMTHLYIEDMRKLINDHNVQDVQATCKCLRISPDPAQWSNKDVRDWVIWQCRQYHIECPNLDYFNMTGAEFSNLTEDMFKFAAPQAGQVLCARLIVWRSVVEQTTAYSDYVPQITQIPIPTSPSLTTSSHGSVSPTPSAWSEESQHEEPVQHFKVPATTNDDCLPEEPVHHHRQTIQLWQFLKLLLLDPSGNFTDCIRWLDRSRGIFKIENSSRVAKLWGKRKNRPAMNYDKLSRSIRQYYKKGIITKTETTKRLVYQFCKP